MENRSHRQDNRTFFEKNFKILRLKAFDVWWSDLKKFEEDRKNSCNYLSYKHSPIILFSLQTIFPHTLVTIIGMFSKSYSQTATTCLILM